MPVRLSKLLYVESAAETMVAPLLKARILVWHFIEVSRCGNTIQHCAGSIVPRANQGHSNI